MTEKYTCPVCGFPELTEEPRVEGVGGSYEICYSCGFEFGVTDDDLGYTDEQWRAKWIAEGMPWHSKFFARPDGWDPARQLADLLRDGP
jgi:hypothetical protein